MFGQNQRVIPELDEGDTSIRVGQAEPIDTDSSSQIIKTELLKWTELALSLLLSLVALMLCELASLPLVYCVLPLILMDSKSMIQVTLKLRNRSM